MKSQKTDVSCFSGNLFFGRLTLESLNGSLVGRADVLWNFLKGQQLQGLLVCPPSFWSQHPWDGVLSGTAASVLMPERFLPLMSWVKVLEFSTPLPHPLLEIFIFFVCWFFFCQYGLEG